MAGNGPAPSGKALRRNTDSKMKQVPVKVFKQPTLASASGTKINPFTDEPFRKVTLLLWKSLTGNPMTKDFIDTDWLLIAAAVNLYDFYWSGHPEIYDTMRLAFKPFGLTPEDRLRHRVQFAVAVSTEQQAISNKVAAQSSVDRYRDVQASIGGSETS